MKLQKPCNWVTVSGEYPVHL